MQAREEEPFFSVEDMQIRSKVNKNVIDTFRRNHVLDSLTKQISFRSSETWEPPLVPGIQRKSTSPRIV